MVIYYWILGNQSKSHIYIYHFHGNCIKLSIISQNEFNSWITKNDIKALPIYMQKLEKYLKNYAVFHSSISKNSVT